jgi:2-dehydropantoate 2-reductase
MKILVVGAGATGGYFGARLAQAGADVTFLLRPARAAAVRADGLHLTGQGRDEVVRAAVTTADEVTDPYDLLLVGVKNGDLDSAMEDMAPAVGPGTLIVPFLNGLWHMDRLNERFGATAVLGGVVKVASVLDERGHIVTLGPDASLTVGSQPGAGPADLVGVAQALDVKAFDFALSDDILGDMWAKWVFIATVGALTCLMRGTVGEIVAVPGGSDLGPAVLAEAAAIASACGFAQPPGHTDATAAAVTQPGSALTSSMYRDVAAGHPTESDYILGDLIARAQAHNAEAPLLAMAAIQLRIHNTRAGATPRP